jgi:hypothetical protein
MALDPLSLGVAGAGLLFDFIKGRQAQKSAADTQAIASSNLLAALANARAGRTQSMGTAGSLRLDQFGNATYYDPAQGRFVTSFSPEQQALIEGGQQRQARAQTRGAQASEDYNRLRSEYLYNQPKSEAESYKEITDLLNQARGTEERQLSTLAARESARTRGNVPEILQNYVGTTPGQQLADQMLKARSAALGESIQRRQARAGELLPALKQFESTANYVAPVDPTGGEIIGMQNKGIEEMLKTGTDYDKLLATLASQGNQTMVGAGVNATRAATAGPGGKDFLALAKLLQPGKEAAGADGTVGGTRGARASTRGGISAPDFSDQAIDIGTGADDPYMNQPFTFGGSPAVPDYSGVAGNYFMRGGTSFQYDPTQTTFRSAF